MYEVRGNDVAGSGQVITKPTPFSSEAHLVPTMSPRPLPFHNLMQTCQWPLMLSVDDGRVQ